MFVTISSRRGHGFILAHNLHEPLCLLCRLIFLVSAVIVEFVNFAAQITVVLIRNRGRVRIGQQLAFWGAYGLDPILRSSEG